MPQDPGGADSKWPTQPVEEPKPPLLNRLYWCFKLLTLQQQPPDHKVTTVENEG
jgi:hypothetical protein